MKRHVAGATITVALLAGGTCVTTGPALPAEATPQRLVNADKEPQNWLMNHRTYDGQRFSPLARINKDNVKGLKLAYAVPLGGGAGNEWIQATPLAEDVFLYITDSWGVLYKIDGTSGDSGRIVWRMDPKQQKQSRNRGATMWGNLVVTAAAEPPRIIATDKESGRVAWESSFADTPEVELSSAPLAIKDKIIVGAAGGDQGVRDWIAGLDAKSGNRLWQKYVIPAPGELGSETWKDKNNAWRTGGGHGHSTAMFLDLKSQARVEDLLRGLIIESGNDAAITLAEGIGGSEDGFTQLMNKRAQSRIRTATSRSSSRRPESVWSSSAVLYLARGLSDAGPRCSSSN